MNCARRVGMLAAVVTVLAGCSLEPVKSGGRCQRSTQCDPGLGCVEGKCSKDLAAIAETNTIPMFGAGAGGGAAGAGGQTAGAGGGGTGGG